MQKLHISHAQSSLVVRFENPYLPVQKYALSAPYLGVQIMAAYDLNRNYATAHTANRIGYYIVSALSAFATWNDARKTRQALSALSDRELEDIGLMRGDIDYVSRDF
jgi:uncharacterized protein YjiS (DUF1127 family)